MKELWIRLMASLPLGSATVLICNGRAVATRGTLRPALLDALTDTARSNGLTHACIHATQAPPPEVELTFFGVPKHLHQRFRNIWCAHAR